MSLRSPLWIFNWTFARRGRHSDHMSYSIDPHISDANSRQNVAKLAAGAGLLAFTAISWGGLLQIAKPMLEVIDPVWLNTLRYAASAPVFVIVLLLIEGRRSLSFEGHAFRMAALGTIGFAGFGIVTLLGVQRTRPEHAALIVALMPLVSTVIAHLRGRAGVSPLTMACMLLGMLGVLITASRGDPMRILHGGIGVAEALVLTGVACWAVYTQGAAAVPLWSPLRYTALSCLASLPGFALIAAGASAVGWIAVPVALPASVWLGLGYIVVFATVLAMLGWNAGIRRLGPVNGVLFINLLPVSAFAIGIALGARFSSAEVAGAAMVVASLLLSNLEARQRLGRLAVSVPTAQRQERA